MIVCHCRAVSDRAIRKAVREGASCRADVARANGAGQTCGGCAAVIDDILESERVRVARFAPLVELPASG